MINQQLIFFIREQIQKGLSREVISNQLLANDWTRGDIEEGFRVVGIPPQTQIPLQSEPLQQTHISTAIPNLQFNQNKSTTETEEKSHLSRNVILIVIALLLLTGGVFAFIFRDDLKKSPLIKVYLNIN